MRALIVTIACSCTQAQVHTTHRVSEIVTAGGLVGLLACGVGAAVDPADDKTILEVGLVFVPVSVIGALLYITTLDRHHSDETQVVTLRERHRAAAWELTKQAEDAARADDCNRVQAIDPRVRDLDRDLHGSVFLRDAAIQRCLHQF